MERTGNMSETQDSVRVSTRARNCVNDAAGRRTARNGGPSGCSRRSAVTSVATGTNAHGHAFNGIGNRTTTVSLNGINTVCTANSLNRNYWGLDLSGTLQGAGGAGGLLAVGIDGQLYFPLYDNNGNVTEYVDVSGAVRARYGYSPFGGTTAQSGDLADMFRFRFSTKYCDAETGLYYYGYRFYAPDLGRWVSRDPMGEESFRINYSGKKELKQEGEKQEEVYVYCLNSPLTFFDPDGAMASRLVDRLHPPKGKKLVTVPRCSILIMYGHHFQNPANEHHGKGFENIWNIVPATDKDKGYAYAGIITCMAGAVPNEIPLPGYTPVSSGSELEVNGFGLTDTDMSIEWEKIKAAATNAAEELCKKCCQKKIHIEVDSYGLNFADMMRMPCEFSWDVPCK
jgi:RHS repeat-associated protein